MLLIVMPFNQQQYVAKTGLFPFNRDAISDDTITPSLVTERKDPNDNEPDASEVTNEDVLRLPARKIQCKVPRNNPSAKIFSSTGPDHQLPTQKRKKWK
jgi:hypothetical protein